MKVVETVKNGVKTGWNKTKKFVQTHKKGLAIGGAIAGATAVAGGLAMKAGGSVMDVLHIGDYDPDDSVEIIEYDDHFEVWDKESLDNEENVETTEEVEVVED